MARLKGSKDKKPRVQFCPKGHDTLVVGRDSSGMCTECKRIKYVPVKVDTRIKQFCINRHDTLICGRYDNGHCIECRRIQGLERRIDIDKDSRLQQFCPKGHNKDIVGRAKNRSCAECARIKSKIAYYENKEGSLAKKKKWNLDNPEKVKIQQDKYRKAHPEVHRISALKQKTNRGLRVVAWGQEGMVEYYRNMPPGMTEEHIIPLQGDLVSGLHVIWNLDYLPKSKNSSKSNKCTPEEATRFYEQILIGVGLKYKI